MPVAFPGAEGYGKNSYGGSGRHPSSPTPTVYKVTTLAASGPGSFREAVEAAGPRIVIFEVSGTIYQTYPGPSSFDVWELYDPYITIAGETAPGQGITLRNVVINIKTHDVVIRHIRFRVGNEVNGIYHDWRDNVTLESDPAGSCYNVIFDHCTFSWGVDENLGMANQNGGVSDVTVQDCMLYEGLFYSGIKLDEFDNPEPHSMGSLVSEGSNISFLRCLFAHNSDRNPLYAGGSGEIINCYSYNHKWYGFWCFNRNGGAEVSLIKNIWEDGNDTGSRSGIYINDDVCKIYLLDNLTADRPTNTGAQWDAADPASAAGAQVFNPPITLSGAAQWAVEDTKANILASVGPFPLNRDTADARIITDCQNGTGSIIDSPSEVGGWPTLAQETRTLTIPNNPHEVQVSGYTNIEEWLHGYADTVVGGGPAPDPIVRTWVGADSSWNTASNWSPSGVPGPGDDVVFSSSDTTACTLDVNASCLSLTMDSGSGSLALGSSGYTLDIGTGGFDGNGGSLNLGDATITCSGDWDDTGLSSFSRGGDSTLIMDGSAKTLRHTGGDFQYLTIAGTITWAANASIRTRRVLKVNSGATLSIGSESSGQKIDFYSGEALNNEGTIDFGTQASSNYIRFYTGGATYGPSGGHRLGTITGTSTYYGIRFLTSDNKSITGDCDISVDVQIDASGGSNTVTFNTTGTAEFSGDVDLNTDTGETLTVDLATNGATLRLGGDWNQTGAGNGVTWSAAGQNIELAPPASTTKTVNFNGGSFGKVVIDGAGTTRLTSNVTTTGDFELIAGTLDIDSYTVNVGTNLTANPTANIIVNDTTGTGAFNITGNVDLNGTASFSVDWNDADISALGAGTNRADYTDVTGSNNSSGNMISVYNGTVGTSTGWSVQSEAPAPSVAQVKAGQDGTGSAATYASSQTASTTQAYTFNATGLTAGTAYKSYFVWSDGVDDSAVFPAAGDEFTTLSAAYDETATLAAAPTIAASENYTAPSYDETAALPAAPAVVAAETYTGPAYAETAALTASPAITAPESYTAPSYAETAALTASEAISAVETYSAGGNNETAALTATPTLTASEAYAAPAYEETSVVAASPAIVASDVFTAPGNAYDETATLTASPAVSGAETYTAPDYDETATLTAAGLIAASEIYAGPGTSETATLTATPTLTASETWTPPAYDDVAALVANPEIVAAETFDTPSRLPGGISVLSASRIDASSPFFSADFLRG